MDLAFAKKTRDLTNGQEALMGAYSVAEEEESMSAHSLGDDDRHDDVEEDRQQQRLPGDGDRGDAEQQADDGREGEDHDHVVDGDLAQGEMRLAVEQIAPHEHHRRAGSGGQQDQAGDVGLGSAPAAAAAQRHGR